MEIHTTHFKKLTIVGRFTCTKSNAQYISTKNWENGIGNKFESAGTKSKQKLKSKYNSALSFFSLLKMVCYSTSYFHTNIEYSKDSQHHPKKTLKIIFICA